MPNLPPNADLDFLRRSAKDRLKSLRHASSGSEADSFTLAATQNELAREHGFPNWSALVLEVRRRQLLELRTPESIAAFVASHPQLDAAVLTNWADHPNGASPLGFIAMARYNTVTGEWGDAPGAGEAALVLVAAGAPVNGLPDDPETPLITAASYGDSDVAAVLIAAGADVDMLAKPSAGGVPNGSALLHAAVFGNTDVLDVLVSAGAQIRSPEEAAAAGTIDGWITADTDRQTRIRALVMAVDHERLDVIRTLVSMGTPINEADEVFGRHPVHLAIQNGRSKSLKLLQELQAK